MQKLLPKLHGSKTKLTPVLVALKTVVTEPRFPISYAKIVRMEQRLKQNGFTSYAEA
jgi:5-methylcytosine-specific restriction protein B